MEHQKKKKKASGSSDPHQATRRRPRKKAERKKKKKIKWEKEPEKKKKGSWSWVTRNRKHSADKSAHEAAGGSAGWTTVASTSLLSPPGLHSILFHFSISSSTSLKSTLTDLSLHHHPSFTISTFQLLNNNNDPLVIC